MLRQLNSTIRSRRLQAHQLSSWRRRKLSKSEADDCDAFRQVCISLLETTELAIEHLPPRQVGALFSVLRKCIVIFAVLASGNTPNVEMNDVIKEVKHWINWRCAGVSICTTALLELAIITTVAVELEYQEIPACVAVLMDLNGENCSYEQMQNSSAMLRKVATRLSLAILHESLPKLRAQYSFRDMVAFTRGYRQEETADDDEYEEPYSEDLPIEYNTDDTEAEYKAIGKRIDLSAFCKPVELVSNYIECPICMAGLSDMKQDQIQQAVATKCGHEFHKQCLDKWVNDSGMNASNTCPTCRTVLCKSRERVHDAVQLDSLADLDESDYSSASDGSSIESLSALPPRPHIRPSEARIETRITAHLSSSIDDYEDDASSAGDDSSVSSNDSREPIPLDEIFDVLRAERVLRTRLSSF